MPLSIGVNLRVTGHCNQGGRKYMEDMFSVAYQQSSNDRELEYAFFGIFDGHGGGEAATFAKENLMDIIVKQKNFWSDNDEDVLKAIRDGYVNTHYAMWRELDKWPRTASGLPSTAGTTASIAFIRKGKIFIGHVGDSAIILGYQEEGNPLWKAKALTRDHKPECGDEMTRIQESGGKVVSKSGVPRVVWNRPRLGHKGPVRRSTHIDEIPFLAVARSLGDLWSYNSELNTFVVSPEPDVKVIKIDVKSYRCLIFGTDGLWNMLSAEAAVATVQAAERHNEKHLIASQQTGGQGDGQMWINPSKSLVDRALDRWSSTRLRADNTSVVTLMLDPPGPTHSEILLSQKREQMAAVAKTPISPITPEIASKKLLPNVSIHMHPTSPVKDSPPQPPQKHSEAPEPIPYSCPETPMDIPPPSYSDIQKYPDSSNNILDQSASLVHDKKLSSKSLNSLSCKENALQNQRVLEKEESIQVAEISSSDASEDQQTIAMEESNILSMKINASLVESTLDNEIDDICNKVDDEDAVEMDMLDSLKFLDERVSWLEEVPEPEKFEPKDSSNKDHQRIRYSDPPVARHRRGIHDNNTISKRIPISSTYNSVMRQSNGRRRHTIGVSQSSSNLQLKQRRSLTPKTPVASGAYLTSAANRLKRSARKLVENELDKRMVSVGTKNSVNNCGDKIKESSDSDVLTTEPCSKRKTRSEDARNMQQDENDPANQKIDQHNNRLQWLSSETISKNNGVLNPTTLIPEKGVSPNSFKRRNLEKKATPVKTIRRPSVNRSTPRNQIRESRTGTSCSGGRRVVELLNSLAESSSASAKRWLRSDSIAATPIKTLRSRNVDIAGQTVSAAQVAQQMVKKLAVETPTKLKQPASGALGNTEVPQTSGLVRVKPTSVVPSTTPLKTTPNRIKQICNVSTPINCVTPISTTMASTTSSGSISKRAKTPYNPSARSLSTRSRIKRLSK